MRTGEAGIGGVSLLLIERTEGLTTEKIPVSYGGSAGTALVILEDVKVPVENLLGEENRGFQGTRLVRCACSIPRCKPTSIMTAVWIVIMGNFNHERWYIAATLQGAMRGIVDECFRWSSYVNQLKKQLLTLLILMHFV